MIRLALSALVLVLIATSASAQCGRTSIFRGRTVTHTVVVQAVQAAPKPPVVAPTAAPAAACQSVEVTKARSGRISDFLGRLRPRSSARSGC